MTVVFYIAGAVALLSTLLVVTCRTTIHALLYLVVSLLAVAIVFYTLGAPFVAALEVIVYAGAIIVLFLFTVMLLNVGREAEGDEAHRLRAISFLWPGLLAAALLAGLGAAIASGPSAQVGARAVGPRAVGIALYGPYAIGVELASTLLLAALIGARHLGQRQRERGFADLAPADVVAPAPDLQLVAVGAPAAGAAAAGGESDASSAAGRSGGAAGGAAAGEAPPQAPDDTPAPRTTRFWRKDDD
jgi:NADH-quinone oxidoreductase subunit J